jgi:uncharacterized surface protein with fasciclin (FAS1) repeats
MILWRRRRAFAMAGAIALGAGALGARTGLAQTAAPSAGAQPQRNAADAMAADGRFTQFLELLGRAGMIDQLRGAGPFTVFAPTTAAFLGAPSAMLADLVGTPAGGTGSASPDPVRLRALVQYHIVADAPFGMAAPPTGDRRVRAISGSDLRVQSDGSVVQVSNPAPAQQMGGMGVAGANVMPPARTDGPPILASNGVIYPITGLLFP